MRYTLIGGHSAGRVVEFDGPAPPSMDVAYRESRPTPADPFALAFGYETYDLMIFQFGTGPEVRAYCCTRTSPAPSGLPE